METKGKAARRKLLKLLLEIDEMWDDIYDYKNEDKEYDEDEKIVLQCAGLAHQIAPLVRQGKPITPHVMVSDVSARIHFNEGYVYETVKDLNEKNPDLHYRYLTGKWM